MPLLLNPFGYSTIEAAEASRWHRRLPVAKIQRGWGAGVFSALPSPRRGARISERTCQVGSIGALLNVSTVRAPALIATRMSSRVTRLQSRSLAAHRAVHGFYRILATTSHRKDAN